MKPAKLLSFVSCLNISGHTSYGIALILVNVSNTEGTTDSLRSLLRRAYALAQKTCDSKQVHHFASVMRHVKAQTRNS